MRATSATSSLRAHASGDRCSRSGGPIGRGFTLIEVMVVLVILVLIATAVPVALDRALPGRRVAVTAQKLLAALRDARSLSTAQGRVVTLAFSGAGLTNGDRISVDFPSQTRVSLSDVDGVNLKTLTVYPDGTLTDARITVTERKHIRSLRLSGLTGRVMLEAPDRAR